MRRTKYVAALERALPVRIKYLVNRHVLRESRRPAHVRARRMMVRCRRFMSDARRDRLLYASLRGAGRVGRQ